MALFEWKDEYSVKITEIDQQHKKLIDLINQLHDSMLTQTSKENMAATLDGLINYAIEHFFLEEKYFLEYNYPATNFHVNEHQAFTQKVKEFQASFETGKTTLSMDVLLFLKDWLIRHIKGTDQKYTAFFNEQGLK